MSDENGKRRQPSRMAATNKRLLLEITSVRSLLTFIKTNLINCVLNKKKKQHKNQQQNPIEENSKSNSNKNIMAIKQTEQTNITRQPAKKP